MNPNANKPLQAFFKDLLYKKDVYSTYGKSAKDYYFKRHLL
jgi:hypothetical protein